MIEIDLDAKTVAVISESTRQEYPLDTPSAFEIISKAWLRCGWDNRYARTFTWLGIPISQLPEDMIRIQEVIYTVRPDVIIETGLYAGGCLVFFASLCKAMNHGRVIGVDVALQERFMGQLRTHELIDYITLIEGDSVAVVSQVKSMINFGEKVLVMLDSSHSKDHVLAELNAYSDLVSVGSYIVVEDGIHADLEGALFSEPDWAWNNPKAAVEEFVKSRDDFVIEEPEFVSNIGGLTHRVTYWPSGFCKRIK